MQNPVAGIHKVKFLFRRPLADIHSFPILLRLCIGGKRAKFLAVLQRGFWERHANAHRAFVSSKLMRAGEQGSYEAETPTAKL